MRPARLFAPLLAMMALIAAITLGACSSDEVLRSVYETGRNVCKQADNCTAEEN